MPNGFGAEHLKAAAVMMAPDHSPQPWHVRLGGYRVNMSITETIPQLLADGWTAVMQTAVEVWADPEGHFQPDLDFIDMHDDEMVEKRIAGYQLGYDKEFVRREVGGYWHDFEDHKYQEKERYIFADMPMNLKRAIVSRWDALHAEYLNDHPDMRYAPDFGYYWRVEADGVVVRIKNFSGSDKGICPTKDTAENWERAGLPGGLYGYAGAYGYTEAASPSSELWRFVEGVEPPDLTINRRDGDGSANEPSGVGEITYPTPRDEDIPFDAEGTEENWSGGD